MAQYSEEEIHFRQVVKVLIAIVVFLSLITALWMWGMPKYRIYKQDLKGQAELREQEWTKKILVEQKKAENEGATLDAERMGKMAKAEADREITRASGVAKANEIIAQSLNGNEAYLRYLWIDKLSDNQNVIYVPTEAGLPLLEAGKRP